jgi:DNA-binding response OmpR family regulator
VREFIGRALSRVGFQVTVASPCVCPHVATACVLDCCPDLKPPDLVIVAVMIDRLCSGADLAQKAVRRWPGVKVLAISGCPVPDWPAGAAKLLNEMPDGSLGVLQKPFTCQELESAVRALLNRKSLPPGSFIPEWF